MKLALGTAQFGLDYGVTNAHGQVDEGQVRAILAMAHECGVDTVDTAPAYGNSEQVIGRCKPEGVNFHMVTKVPKCDSDNITAKDCDLIRSTFLCNLDDLRVPKVAGLLLHDADDLLKPGADQLIGLLNQFKFEGLVEKIGISVYAPQQLQTICQRYEIDLLQCPLSVFDQRFNDESTLLILRANQIEVHARSIFLQGLLLLSSTQIPAAFESYKPAFDQYYTFCETYGVTPLQLTLNFLKQCPQVTRVVVGVCSLEQLQECLDAYKTSVDEQLDYGTLKVDQLDLIDPRRWKV